MFGVLTIKSNKVIPFDNYEFGISAVNQTTPYLWGGLRTFDEIGAEKQVFTGLTAGKYKYFVRRKTDKQIVKAADADVFINDLQTFYFARNIEDRFQFDAVSKRIILSDSHPLFNARFAILHSSFNGLTVRSVVNLIPSLLSFDEVSFSENAFNISEMQLVGDDIYSVVVKMF